jgi:hypothetical protein
VADAADTYQMQTLENNTVTPACKGPEYFHLQACPVVGSGTDPRDCESFLPKTGFGSNQVPFKTGFINKTQLSNRSKPELHLIIAYSQITKIPVRST